ncbi:uncharacterized protein LOC119172737 [Rhipicephalus microplus]|uniref:uncharacterized protein LOC119172737 n=1 Tax=Rhipicephalus microplus TaxID=6941 RepID=UPI003F6B471A
MVFWGGGPGEEELPRVRRAEPVCSFFGSGATPREKHPRFDTSTDPTTPASESPVLAAGLNTRRRDTRKMQPVSARSASWLLLVAAAVLLVQVLGDEVTTKPVVADQESGDTRAEALPTSPPCDKETKKTAVPPKKTGITRVRHPLLPFNLGIAIPYIFNMRLLTGPAGTGLGLNVPAIFNLQLDAAHRRRPGLLLSLFGNREPLFNFNRRKRPGNPLLSSPLRPPFAQLPEQDNDIDIKRKPVEKAA